MSCYLRVIGERLDIDSFEQKTQISWTGKSYAGESVSPGSKRKSKYSSLSIATSDAGFTDFKRQVTDTIAFLNYYKSDLTHIANTPEIDFATIDFGVDSKIDKEHLTQSFYLPPQLISVCGDLGISIEISLYKPDLQVILEENRQGKISI